MQFPPQGGASQVALVVKNPPVNVGNRRDVGWIPGSGRSPGGAHGNPLQCSCLENPTVRGAWRATAHRAAKESDVAEHTGHTSGQPRLSHTWLSSRIPSGAFSIIYNFFFIYLVLTALGLHCYMRAVSSCREWGLLSSRWVWPSHCGVFSWCRASALGWEGFSSHGPWA